MQTVTGGNVPCMATCITTDWHLVSFLLVLIDTYRVDRLCQLIRWRRVKFYRKTHQPCEVLVSMRKFKLNDCPIHARHPIHFLLHSIHLALHLRITRIIYLIT